VNQARTDATPHKDQLGHTLKVSGAIALTVNDSHSNNMTVPSHIFNAGLQKQHTLYASVVYVSCKVNYNKCTIDTSAKHC
jgi:hypothetical protein